MFVEAELQEFGYGSKHSDYEGADEDVFLDRETVDSQETTINVTPSIFVVHESKKTLKLTTDTLDWDKNLVNQDNDSVLNTLWTSISTGKLPTTVVEARFCKGLLGYTNQLEKLFFDKETH